MKPNLWIVIPCYNEEKVLPITCDMFLNKIKELETILNELENGTSDLEDSINKYTKAMKLVNECDEKLKSIEEQVNKIILENGEITDFEIEE